VYRLALDGKKLVSERGFGAAFNSGRQYVMRAGNETLGTLPIGHGLSAGDPIYYSGRRWAVQQIIEQPPTVLLRPARGGRPPRFTGSPIAPSELVVATMRDLFEGRCKLPDCDLGEQAHRLWNEARRSYKKLGLTDSQLLPFDDDVILFPWCGPRAQSTLVAALRHLGLAPAPAQVAIIVSECSVAAVRDALKAIAHWNGLPAVEELVRTVNNPRIDKHDSRLGPVLERRNYASARFDEQGTKRVASDLLKSQAPFAS
jgi:ATP-dependent helicase Lhr and Lhr-like helicase